MRTLGVRSPSLFRFGTTRMLLVDRNVPPANQLWITSEISRRNPGILIIRANGPEAVITQLRQAFTERRAEEEKTRGDLEVQADQDAQETGEQN